MCLAVPAEVVEIKGTKATINTLGVLSDVSVELLGEVKVGDYIIVHAGCAIAKIDEQEAKETIKLYEELEGIMNEKNR